jgi:hypothetical protein
MVRRWSWANVGLATAWPIAFAGTAFWEFETAQPFSLRGGQAGLPYSWTPRRWCSSVGLCRCL